MSNLPFLRDVFQRIAHSPLQNYVIPGLTSYLLSTPGPDGVVRLLQNSRLQLTNVTPHSHRFDFTCLVLQGCVLNRLWTRQDDGDLYAATKLVYQGKPGSYKTEFAGPGAWTFSEQHYHEGEQYDMKANEVHSILFSKDAIVLFHEGPQVSDTSIILEPYVDGKIIPTFKVEPWMFLKGD